MKKILTMLLAALTVSSAALLTSCAPDDVSTTDALIGSAREIILEGDTVNCEIPSVYVNEENRITITEAGYYRISGTLNDGQIYVDCVDAGRIDLILDNANITNDDGACIVIMKSTDAVVTLKDGSVNTLTDGSKYKFDNPADDEPDAVIFSKENTIINGSGKLIVGANYSGGIFSKDGLKIDGGEIVIDSVGHAIKGKDYLVINDGNITINSVGDGIKSTNTDNDTVGYIDINGGVINISSEDEAVQTVTAFRINGGELNIDSLNNGIRSAGSIEFNGGTVVIEARDTALDAMTIEKTEDCSVTIAGNPFEIYK